MSPLTKTMLKLFVAMGCVLSGCAADPSAMTDAPETREGSLTATPVTLPNRANAEIDALREPTAFSGNGPVEASLLKAFSTNAALRGLTWGEDTDDPCFVQAMFRDVASDGVESNLTLNCCDGHSPGNEKTVMLPSDYFATGLRVCMNRDGDKVKGVELIGENILCLLGAPGYYVMDDGVTVHSCRFGIFCSEYVLHGDSAPRWVECGTDTEISVQREHTNCKTWGTERRCPDGMVATGLSFGLEDGSGDREMIEGIALQCSPIHD